jgi:excisionase family DNA binding protein
MPIHSSDLGHDNQLRAPAFYSPKETETLLNISHATCYRLIANGKLDARKIGTKTLISAKSIERLIANLPRAAVRTP